MTVTSDALKAVSDEIREIQKRAGRVKKPLSAGRPKASNPVSRWYQDQGMNPALFRS